MIGIDTTFLVETEVEDHPHHDWANAEMTSILERGESIALAAQVLTEFVHVVTDAKRFGRPLTMARAIERAEQWWMASEVVQLHATGEAMDLFFRWMSEHRLGRKRILDTMLAATYRVHVVDHLLTTNVRDYAVFGCFNIRGPAISP